MIFKNKKVAKEPLTVEKKYLNAINAVKSYANVIDSIDIISYLKLIRTAIIEELASEFNNKILYHGIFEDNEHRAAAVIPYFRWDENSVPYFVELENKYECDLSKDKIVSFPWHIDRFVSAFNIVANQGFKYMPTNHRVYYFPQLNLYIAFNGLHSLGAGVATKKGIVPCVKAYDLTRMFETIHSDDGVHWVSNNGNISVDDISDFRFALIYEISKLIWEKGERL